MYLGSQVPYDRELLTFLRQMGVTHVDVTPGPGMGMEDAGHGRAAPLLALRAEVEALGLTLAAMHLPLSSAGIERQCWPQIMLGGPERDRQIEQVQRTIAAAGQAGIPLLLYNLAILPVVRTAYRTPGRGGVTYSHFDYVELSADPPHPNAPVTADDAWERIAYFIERVVPVAEEYGVRLGCHPHDPGMPAGRGYRGVERVLGSVAGLEHLLALSDSPYHGLNFCQGTVAEMCTSPDEVYAAIRNFGARGRIFWVHLRNIRGGYLHFDEVFPDEGDVDMVRAVRLYHEVGYRGVLVPDHVPHSELDTPYGHRAFAFCLGYIRALIQAVAGDQP